MMYRALTLLQIFLFSTSALATTNIWLEAESGGEHFPIIVGSDMTASDHTFLVSIKHANYHSRSNDDGRIVFEFYVSRAGEYTLWGRTRVPTYGTRPFDVSTGSGNPSDNQQWTRWAADKRSHNQYTHWLWHNSGVKKYFSKGMHKLHFIQRAGGGGVHLDKILLTNNSSYTPSAIGGAETKLDIENPYRSAAVPDHGQLSVQGGQLKNKNGQAVQLKGISTHGLQWFPLADKQTIPYMAEFFGVEVVRLAMYVEDFEPANGVVFWGGYKANKDKLMAKVEKGIEDAIATGVYVLVDWHIHDDPSKHTTIAKDFFSSIAKKYGHYPNVIYEIANEPVAVSWDGTIKPYAETIIAEIRKHDSDNIIVVGTPNWSQDVDRAARNPLHGSNIMYSFHYYAATHSLGWAKSKINKALDAGLAIFVTEWGSSDVGTSHSNFSVAGQWMDYLQSKKISWTNWSLGTKDENSSILKPTAPLIGPWAESDLTEAGSWIKPYFNEASEDSAQSAKGADSASSGSSSANSCNIESGKKYGIKNVNSGFHMDVRGVSKRNGANIMQYSQNANAGNRQFIAKSKSSGYFAFKAVHSGLYWDVYRGNGNLQQYGTGSGSWNKQFKLVSSGSGCRIKVRYNDKCLEVQNGSTSAGANVRSASCVNNNKQRWLFELK